MTDIIAYEGTKVSLGLMQEEYIPLFLPWLNKRKGVDGTLQRAPYTQEDAIDFIRNRIKKGEDEVFSILLKERGKDGKITHRYIGHMGIHRISWPERRATTGSIIVTPEGRGQGYGTEAKLLLLYHAFMVLGVRKIFSSVKAFNAKSLGSLLKSGYQIIGRYKEHVFHEGEFVDEILLEVFRKDWEPIWKQYQETKELPKLTAAQREIVTRETSLL